MAQATTRGLGCKSPAQQHEDGQTHGEPSLDQSDLDTQAAGSVCHFPPPQLSGERSQKHE